MIRYENKSIYSSALDSKQQKLGFCSNSLTEPNEVASSKDKNSNIQDQDNDPDPVSNTETSRDQQFLMP